MSLKILYRGHLSDCNYSCPYCPFAMQRNSAAQQAQDRADLARFVAWARANATAARPLEILITPWGEALRRMWYREALVALSHTAHIAKIAIQTNLSCGTRWLAQCNPHTTALWLTYHPGQVPQARFLAKCQALAQLGIRFSVGVVGLREHFAAIAALRAALPAEHYLWINAYKRSPQYYSEEEIRTLTAIDPHFPTNLLHYPSLGRACRAGAEAISIAGNGEVTRCHFIKQPLGNIFTQPLDTLLQKTPCTAPTCHCHIGYIHLEHLQLDEVYGNGLLERVPRGYA